MALFGSAEARNYNPTVRDKIARALMGPDTRSDSFRGQMVEGLLGSTGSGNARMGLVDWIPGVGQLLQAQEAGRQLATPGQRLSGALNLGMALPVPAAGGLFGRGAAKAVERAAAEAVQAAPKPRPQITAYHGSPHQFDKFDASKIGTGEGAQVYGHGLYFAENEDVARSYRTALTPPGADLYINGERQTDILPHDANAFRDLAERVMPGDTPTWIKTSALKAYKEAVESGKPFTTADLQALAYQKAIGPAKPDAKAVEQINRMLGSALEGLQGVEFRPRGAMYEVGIHAAPDQFIDWDAPLKAQSPGVRDAINRVGRDVAPYAPDRIADDMRLIEMQGLIRSPEATKRLSEHGVAGVKYLDQGSRGVGSGTRNYVVFDPDTIEILRRYGIAGMLGGGLFGAGYAARGQKRPGT